ncbi:ferric enterobactin uptake receptor [Helicobacter sp. MIT 14-3879]|nr:ferric enterobactin uptake receptor [Helicobacter sp. MIT 14-3879]
MYIGESVVSASGYEQKIKNAPASISVIPKEEILTRPIRDLGDVVQDIPGVYVEAGKTGGNTISMRGLDSGYTLILIDGKRQNVAQGFDANGFSGTFTSFMPPPSMIDRIEVIRGPASLIYGSDAMGGVINIITKKNVDKITGGVQLETRLAEHYKTFGNIYGINGYISAPIIEKVLSFNVRGGYKYGGQNAFLKPESLRNNMVGSPQHINPYTTWSATGFQNWNAGGRLNWTINENNNIYLDAETYFARTGSLNTSVNQITAIRDFYKINSVLNHSANYNWGNLTSYIQYSQTFWAPHTNIPIGGSKGSSLNWNSKRDNKDIILNSTYNRSFDFEDYGVLVFNGGLNYLYEQLINKSTKFSRHMNEVSIFAEGEYIPFEYLSTTLGLRYNYSDIYTAIPNPRFYINVNPTNFLTFKLGVTSGVRAPNLAYLYDGWTFDASQRGTFGNKDLKPEQSYNYEFSTIFDLNPVFITLTGFYTDFRDQIEAIAFTDSECTNENNCKTYRNIDKSLMAGAEAALKLKPIYGFGLDMSYGFTHTQTLRDTGTGNNFVPKGSPVNNIARHKFTIKPSYRYEYFDIYLRWTGNFKTPTSYSLRNTSARSVVGKYYKDYHLLDLGATYRFLENYSFTFAINNLLDVNFEDYVLYQNGNNQNYINSYQRILPSRSYWLTFKADF